MFSQERLINQVTAELLDDTGLHSAYQTYCGQLTLEDLFCTDSVYIAAKRCAAGFMRKKDTRSFMRSAWLHSFELSEQVSQGRFVPRYYKTRLITERGKRREIKPPVFSCKVVQKVLCDYLIRPLLEPRMVPSTYASVRGRGTKKLYEDIEAALNKRLEQKAALCIVKGDFTAYFATIDVGILLDEILGAYIKDTALLELIRLFSPGELGLSLGNEISQLPASFYLTSFDHVCKDHKRWAYFRYMDDTLAIVSREDVGVYLETLRKYARRLHLCIKEEKLSVLPAGKPFVFCKERFLWDRRKARYYRIMNPAIERTEKRKLKALGMKLKDGDITKEQLDAQYSCVMGQIAAHPHSFYAQKRLAACYARYVFVSSEHALRSSD